MNSIQFKPNAMIFEIVTVAAMNFSNSTAPHSRSRYRNEAGITSRLKISCSSVND